VNGDLPGLPVFATVRTVQHQNLVFTRLPVVNQNKAVPHEKPAVPVHFADIHRISGPVAAWVRGSDMTEPVQLSVGVPHNCEQALGEKNRSPF